MKILIVLAALFFLAGCSSTPTVTVVDAPRPCFPIPEKPKLLNVNVGLDLMKNGKWTITMEQKEFNKMVRNNIVVDTYIKRSYNVMTKYKENCGEKDE